MRPLLITDIIWTGPALIDWASLNFGVEFKKAQIYNIIKQLRFSHQKAKGFYPEADPIARDDFKESSVLENVLPSRIWIHASADTPVPEKAPKDTGIYKMNVYGDRSKEYHIVGEESMVFNGHNTYGAIYKQRVDFE